MVGDAPRHRSGRPELGSELRLNFRAGTIGQREVCLTGKTSAAEEHATCGKTGAETFVRLRRPKLFMKPERPLSEYCYAEPDLWARALSERR
jgi:hypothetical protein